VARSGSTATPLARLRQASGGQGIGAVLARGASGSAGINAAGGLLALLAQLALARLLGVEAFGHYVYAFTWALVLSQIGRLGFQNALVRFTAAYRTRGQWGELHGLARRSAALTLSAGVIAAGAIAASTAGLGARLDAPLARTFVLAALLVPPLALLGPIEGLLRGYRQPVRALVPGRIVIPGATLALCGAVAAAAGLTAAPAAMALTVAAAITGTALGLGWCHRALAAEARPTTPVFHTRYWLRAAVPVLAMTGLNMLMKQTDTLMLGALADTDRAGLYFPVARLSEVAALGLLSINAILGPLISELHTSGDKARLQRILRWSVASGFAVTLAGALVLWLAGEWLLGLFGEAFTVAHPALLVLLGGQLVHAACGSVALLMTMTGHQDRAAIILVAVAVGNALLNAALIPAFGLVGAAVATAIAIATWNVWMFVAVKRRLGVDPSILSWRDARH